MDAKIHNESERYLLKAISELQKYVGCDISVRVEAKNRRVEFIISRDEVVF